MEQHGQPPPPPPQHTYWCHRCDLSVSLSPTRYPFCPHCGTDFHYVEQFDFPDSPPIQSPNPNFPSLISAPSIDDHDINIIDSPDIRRVIQDLTDPDVGNPSFHSGGSVPASKAFVDAMPNVKVFEMLASEVDEGQIMCAICKDPFLAGVEGKLLPCTHVYHSDCILPWFDLHNSCPVCRFKLPDEGDLWNGSLMESEDMYGFGRTLRLIARRHRTMNSGDSRSSMDSLISPTQLAETALVGPANSVETVSSSWQLERGIDSSRSGGGDVGLGVDDEGDVAASERDSGSLSAN